MATKKRSARSRDRECERTSPPSITLASLDPGINDGEWTGLGGPPRQPLASLARVMYGAAGVAVPEEVREAQWGLDRARGEQQRARETPRVADPMWLAQARRAYRALGEAFDLADALDRHAQSISADDEPLFRRGRETVTPILRGFVKWYAGADVATLERRAFKRLVSDPIHEAYAVTVLATFMNMDSAQRLAESKCQALLTEYMDARTRTKAGRGRKGYRSKWAVLAELYERVSGRKTTADQMKAA